jgi:uncharacterized membrane protein
MKVRIVALLSLMALFLGCSTNSTDDLIAPGPETISYNGAVKGIIQNNCIFCHSDPPQNFAPMRLTTYEDVKNAVLTRGLLDRVSRAQGEQGMMPSGGTRLPQATIDVITAWKDQGFPE